MEGSRASVPEPHADDAQSRNITNDPDVDIDEEKVKEEDTKPSGRRSFVWEHFTYVKGATEVKCSYCNKVMAADTKKNGTSALANHLHNVCKRSPVFKKTVLKKQSGLSFKPPKVESGSSSLSTHPFSQEQCRKSVARMCIIDNRPFSIVDDKSFRQFSWDMNPLFRIPSRWTVARDCLAIYKEEADKLKNVLKNQTVSLTIDTWLSVQNLNYMCLTAHWVDDDWVLRKKMLNFCPIANHKGETIGKLVYKCLMQWGIERVFSITVDNAPYNDGAIRFLSTMLKGPHAYLDCKYLHLRCCTHIINLVVRDGLEEHRDSISRIRNAIRYVRSSPARAESFRDCVDKVKIVCQKKPCLDVDTRWNSTYLMLEIAEKYADAFNRMMMVDFGYKYYFYSEFNDDDGDISTGKRNDRVLGAPTDDDWEIARFFINYLRIFYDVIKKISGTKYVTSSMFLGEFVTMHRVISRMCENVDEKKKSMALSMKAKYDKYSDNIDDINLLLYVAVVLDPTFKLLYLEFCLNNIYGSGSPKTKEILDRVVKTMEELYKHYKEKADKDTLRNEKGMQPFTLVHDVSNTVSQVDIMNDFRRFMATHGDGVNKSELEIYLGGELEQNNGKFEILSWWKMHSEKYPILSQIAKNILGMRISVVASESAFSVGGRVIDEFRGSLPAKTVEALICTQDWLRTSETDIGGPIQNIPINELAEMQQKLEKLEFDEFGTEESIYDSYMMDED